MRIAPLIDGVTWGKTAKALAVRYPTTTVALGASSWRWGRTFRGRSPAYVVTLSPSRRSLLWNRRRTHPRNSSRSNRPPLRRAKRKSMDSKPRRSPRRLSLPCRSVRRRSQFRSSLRTCWTPARLSTSNKHYNIGWSQPVQRYRSIEVKF
jgi:hypothetical protein